MDHDDLPKDYGIIYPVVNINHGVDVKDKIISDYQLIIESYKQLIKDQRSRHEQLLEKLESQDERIKELEEAMEKQQLSIEENKLRQLEDNREMITELKQIYEQMDLSGVNQS